MSEGEKVLKLWSYQKAFGGGSCGLQQWFYMYVYIVYVVVVCLTLWAYQIKYIKYKNI